MPFSDKEEEFHGEFSYNMVNLSSFKKHAVLRLPEGGFDLGSAQDD